MKKLLLNVLAFFAAIFRVLFEIADSKLKPFRRSTFTGLCLYRLNLRAFDVGDYVNTTTQTGTGQDLSPEMTTYYDKTLIDYASPKLVHDQFGQVRDIPKNGGKTIEFRKFSPFAKALTPLTEGVIPAGKRLNSTAFTATVAEYGDYAEVSSLLQLTALDNIILETTKLCGYQAGETLDTITREILNGGTNVQYGHGQVSARYLLVGGDSTAANNHYMSVDAILRAARTLKVGKADKIGNSFVAIIHPDSAYDIMHDTLWEAVKTYSPTDLYEGEIGRIGAVRFVETTEAKVFHADDLVSAAVRNLTCASVVTATKVFTIAEALTAGQATALVGRKIIIKGYLYTVASAAAGSAGAATVTVTEAVQGISTGNTTEVIYPGEAGAKGRDVYSTLVLGADAYGTTTVEGGGLRTMVKPASQIGGPLEQFSTVGWKALKTAERLVEAFMVRIETASTFEVGAN
jgi:N4-gp56 family major capsid protein